MAVKPEIETFQNEWELGELIDLVRLQWPESIIEIGTWHGGTLWHWLQMAERVVAVDDGLRRHEDWYQWADEARTEFHAIQGVSDDPLVIGVADQWAPYDFLFIDAAHDYESVRADWNNYSPMVREGGLVAFHDILPRPGYGVSRLWEELTSVEGTRYMTICANEVVPGNEGRCGIGLIYL